MPGFKVRPASAPSFLAFMSGLYNQAMIPERGTGWKFVALWGGHNFLGVCLAAVAGYVLLQFGIVAHNTTIYIVDFVALCLYAPKEFMDHRLNKDARDGVVDTLAVCFGAYLFSAASLFMIESCVYIVLCNVIACAWILYRFDAEEDCEVC